MDTLEELLCTGSTQRDWASVSYGSRYEPNKIEKPNFFDLGKPQQGKGHAVYDLMRNEGSGKSILYEVIKNEGSKGYEGQTVLSSSTASLITSSLLKEASNQVACSSSDVSADTTTPPPQCTSIQHADKRNPLNSIRGKVKSSLTPLKIKTIEAIGS